MEIKINKIKGNEWEKSSFAWRWVKFWKPPGRPIPQELQYIKKFLSEMITKKDRQINVMVLGSTSEYRDLLIDFGCHATIVDFSEENYHILSQKMKAKENYKKIERFEKQYWQTLYSKKKFKQNFDLVLGHIVFNVNRFNQWPNILKSVRYTLKDDGVFLTTSAVRLLNKKLNLSQVVKEYNQKWAKKYDFWRAMKLPVFLCAYNLKRNYMAYPDLCRVIDDGYQKGIITAKDYRYFVNCGFKDFDFKIIIPLESKTMVLFKKYFNKVKKIYFDDAPSYRYIPFFILQK